ncbi:hypothetical protein L596_029103 [Steinernema carpocapsae]|uniref:Oligosaccharyltransferase complex subunit n=1 Tax=Steinernema carpocapsae TaxID=34508 RepID=A0A4U5LTN2_STECR|nr:hypothetical protein L596_029103 [Steinernema carpocapsae]
MDSIIDAALFSVIQPPNVRIQAPRWMKMPSPMQALVFVLGTYFLITGGVVYDIINEPPHIGTTVDERGMTRTVAVMPYRVNGQYIMEGLMASFMFTLGGAGFIILDNCNSPLTPKRSRLLLLSLGFGSLFVAFASTRFLMRMKLPDYLSG